MVATINNFIGFETGGVHELASSSGISVNTTTPRSDAYSANISGTDTGTIDPFSGQVADAGNDYIIGFGIRFTDKTPASPGDFIILSDGSGANHVRLRLEADGDFALIDANNSVIRTITDPFTENSYHYIEVYWQRSGTGTIEAFIDDSSQGSDTSQDLLSGTADFTIVDIAGAGLANYRLDDIYIMSGCTSSADRLGPAEVFAYTSAKASATPDDGGDNLNVGNWGDADVPFAVSVQIEYTDTGAGAVDSDATNGDPEGPLNDSRITGTVNAIKGVWRLERAGGGASDHYGLLGNNVDGTTRSVDLDPASGTPGNFYFVSESADIVPTTGQYCRIGIETTGAQDFECYGMAAMILHIPPPAGDIEGAVTFSATATNTPIADADLEAARVEAATATNTETADANLFAALTETVTAGDAFAAGLDTDHAVAESATATNAEAAEVMLGSDVTFGATASMGYVSEALLAANVTESATAAVAQAAQADLEASASENVTATNTEDEDANFEASLTEDATATNTEVGMRETDGAVAESSTAGDVVAADVELGGNVAESATASAAEDAQADLEATRDESTTATNTEVAGLDTDHAVTESATATVAQTGEVSVEAFVNFGATATVSEDAQAVFLGALIETTTAVVAQAAQLLAEGQLDTSVTVTNVFTGQTDLEVSITFDGTHSTAFDVDAALAASIADTVTAAMIQAGATNFESGLSFAVTAGDQYQRDVTLDVTVDFSSTAETAFVAQLPSLNATFATSVTAGDVEDAIVVFDAQVSETSTAAVQQAAEANLEASVSEDVTASDLTAGGLEIDTAVVFGASMAVAVVGAIVGFTGGRKGGVAIVKAQNRTLTVQFQGRKVS